MYSKSISQRGFTLVEMIVVIGIIGLLSSVVLFSVSKARENSRDKIRVVDIEQIRLTLKLYQEGYGDYPASAYSGEIGMAGGLQTDSQVLALLPQIPVDPKSSDALYGYFYKTGFNCTALGQTVLYVQKFETLTAKANADAVCGTDVDDDATSGMYVILLE